MSFSNRYTIAPEHSDRHITCAETEKAAFEFVSQFGPATHQSQLMAGAQYDIERIGWRIDVKGKERTVDCKPEYSTDTHCYQDNFNADMYIFASYNKVSGSVSLMGWEWKDEYLQNAALVLAGETHDGRRQAVDGHKMQYKQLQSMEKLGEVMSGEFWLIKDSGQLNDRLQFLREWLLAEWDWEHAVQLTVKRYVPSRSLSQNALFHIWCREMADHFSAKGADVDEAKMKDLLKYKLLGTEDRVVNTTVIPNQLRETSSLDKGEMMDFLDRVHDWALDHGVKLSCPLDSEYMRLKSHGG